MVRPTGFEPAAFRVGAERSIQLSYGRIWENALCGEAKANMKGCLPNVLTIIAHLFENEKPFLKKDKKICPDSQREPNK